MSSLIKILILTANPRIEGESSLRVDAEVRGIEEALQRSKYRDLFQVISKLAVRDEDLRRALLEHKPHIVQFLGHGKARLGLMLENDAGEAHIVRTEALSSLFKTLSGRIECVLLNACYSEPQARAIHQFVDYVIGMDKPIGDSASIHFSEGFYDALGAGELFEKAFEMGCDAIELSGSRDHEVPVLKDRPRPNVAPLVERILMEQTDTTADVAAEKPDLTSPAAQGSASQSIGNITISGSDNNSNFINSSGSVNVNQSRVQSSGASPELQSALAALESLKQAIAANDELSGTDKKMAAIPIEEIEEEIQKPQPKSGVINQALTSLNSALDKATTLVEPVSKVAKLIAKIGLLVV